MKLFGTRNKNTFSEKEILAQLDQCAEDFTFPMLDNGYVYPIESRMTIYRNESRWAIIIEVVGFNYRGGGHDGISNCLHVFGNCLEFKPGTNNSNFLYFMDDSDEGEAFDSEYLEHLNPETKSILIRGKKIPVSQELEHYKQLGIELKEPSKVMIWEFLRGLVPEYRNEILATEEELRERIPNDLPEFLRLNQWHHIDLANGEKPNESETFQLIAMAIVTGNKLAYRPTLKPNNHWKNWPNGGTL